VKSPPSYAKKRAPRRAPITHERRELFVKDGVMRLAIVADTHGEPHPNLEAQLRALSPDHVLHAGDVGDLSVLTMLEGIAPLSVVRGNIDGRIAELPDVLTLTVRDERVTWLKILLLHVAVYGPRLRGEVAALARAEDATLVVCGHSHVPFASSERGLTVFNPGSVGPRRFRLPIVFGLANIGPLPTHGLSLIHVDCETGKPWLPEPGIRATYG
jgi:putative phosphoesterase